MTRTMEFTDTLVVVTCWCGVNHAVPENLRKEQLARHRDGLSPLGIYCPVGHSHVPRGKGEAEELRERLERERERAARLAAERDQVEASARAYKGVATRTRKRAAAGVCPCCKRTFKQLARHMKSQHPNFDPEAVDG